MKPFHIASVLLVVVIWGLSFAVVKIGLRGVPPLTLCVVRLFLTSVPAVFLVKRPAIAWRDLALYGICMFALQFGLLFSGMHFGVTAGIAAVILQVHIFFTIGLAILLLKEKPSPLQIVAAVVAFSGIVYVACNIGGDITGVGLLLVVGAAASWGVANIVLRRIGNVNALALIMWGSLFAWPPLLVLAVVLEGPDQMASSLGHLTWTSIGAIIYLSYPVTLIAYAIWSKLLGLYPGALVAPFTLLVPIVSMASSSLLLHEDIDLWKVIAAGLVIFGLCINIFGASVMQRLRPLRQTT
jgi:O-acetylserine/cysteine efflux transporter